METIEASNHDFGGNKRRKPKESFVATGVSGVLKDISLLKSKVAAVRPDVSRLKSTIGCLEPNIETLTQQVIEAQALVCELKVGGVEGIAADVIHVFTTMGGNIMYKVAENVTPPMEKNVDHDFVADIYNDSLKRNISLSPPIKLNSHADHQIYDELPANEVDHLADKRDTVEEARLRKRDQKFPLIGKITRKDSKVLKFLFMKSSRSGHDVSREEVARSGQFGISHEDIQSLCPAISISSKVINIWAAYLCQTKSNSWFFPTFFGEKTRSNGVHVSVASTIVDCGLQRFHRRLKHCAEIFIPLHDDIVNHWFLLVIKLKDKSAELWDCMPELMSLNRRLEIARTTIDLLQKVFVSAMTKGVYYNFPSFHLSCPEGSPTTNNKYDSGIYIMMQMKCDSDKWLEGYYSEAMRSTLALEIVDNPSNELLNSVIAAALKGKGYEQGAYYPAETTQPNAVIAPDCDTTSGIIHEKLPNGWKCRSHRKRTSRV